MGFAFIIATAFFHGWPVLVKGIIIQQLKDVFSSPVDPLSLLSHYSPTLLIHPNHLGPGSSESNPLSSIISSPSLSSSLSAWFIQALILCLWLTQVTALNFVKFAWVAYSATTGTQTLTGAWRTWNKIIQGKRFLKTKDSQDYSRTKTFINLSAVSWELR